jgi:hypothetical protein
MGELVIHFVVQSKIFNLKFQKHRMVPITTESNSVQSAYNDSEGKLKAGLEVLALGPHHLKTFSRHLQLLFLLLIFH